MVPANVGIPIDFFCPLTKRVFVDPMVAFDGLTYERSAIEPWFESNERARPQRCCSPPDHWPPRGKNQLNSSRNGGNTALCQASGAGNAETVRLLIGCKGCDVNKPNKALMTPLHLAVEKGHGEVVRLLLSSPAIRLDVANKRGKTPAELARELGATAIVALFSARGV